MMRTFLYLTFLNFLTAVWAGGYQGCLERVWLYQAYEIDELSDPADQIMGFKCPEPDFDKDTKVCKVDWIRCKSKTVASGQCSYDKFIVFLGKNPMQKGWRIPETGLIDAEATAKRCYEVYKKWNNKIKNFAPYAFVKKQVEYSALITKVGEMVNNAYRNKKTADNAHLWKDFDSTTEKIVTARAGDYGPYLIESAKESTALKGVVTLKIQNLGPNPVADPPVDWKTLDWTLTEDEAKRSGVTDADKRLKAFRSEFYTGKRASDHDQVIGSSKEVQESSKKCR
ncbi:hypothetical protein VTI28DRAFT_3731 [Corynascus sepedonium]